MDKNQIQHILKNYRKEIDQLDDDILSLLSQRFDVIRKVSKIKKENKIPARLKDRVDEVINRNIETSKKSDIDPDLTKDIWERIVNRSIQMEEDFINNK